MILDHTNADSVSHNSHLVTDQLKRLRGMLIRVAAQPENPGYRIAITAPSMLVRLHSNEDGELWYNTGDPKYDTQVGIGSVQVQLTALTTDAELSSLASELIDGIAKLLAERAA